MFILFISEMVTAYRLALMETVEKENYWIISSSRSSVSVSVSQPHVRLSLEVFPLQISGSLWSPSVPQELREGNEGYLRSKLLFLLPTLETAPLAFHLTIVRTCTPVYQIWSSEISWPCWGYAFLALTLPSFINCISIGCLRWTPVLS